MAASEIAAHFGLGDAGFGTLSSLFFWIYAPMQIAVGILLDRYGARRLVLLGTLTCGLGVLLFAGTASPLVGGLGRAATGFGAAFAFVSALYVVNHWFAPERFAVLSGAVNGVGMLGTAIGAIVLTGVIQRHGWQVVFFVTGAIGLVLFGIALLFLREAPATGDVAPNPHIPTSLRRVLGEGRTWLIALMGLLYYMPVNVYGGLWGNDELTHDHGLTAVQAETAISMIFWGLAIGSVAGGALSDAIGHRKWLVAGGAVLTALAYGAAIYGPFESAVVLSVLLFTGGFFGGAQMLAFAMAKEGHPKAITGTVIAFVNMVGIAGAVIFQPLIGFLVERSSGSFGTALLTVPICLLAAALLIPAIREYRHPDHLSSSD